MKIWMLIHKDDPSSFAYGIGRTAAEAYRTTGALCGNPAYTTKQLKDLGYKAVQVYVEFKPTNQIHRG